MFLKTWLYLSFSFAVPAYTTYTYLLYMDVGWDSPIVCSQLSLSLLTRIRL